jgi:hypothetical protein
MVDRRIKAARFPTTKRLDTFDFLSMPSLNKSLVLELARCEYIERNQNVIALGNSGIGKTHIALGLGLAACQRGLSGGFTTTAALVHELMEARDERRHLPPQAQQQDEFGSAVGLGPSFSRPRDLYCLCRRVHWYGFAPPRWYMVVAAPDWAGGASRWIAKDAVRACKAVVR